MQRPIKRPKEQRAMNVSFPLDACDRLVKWAGANGCTEQLAVSIAIVRYAGKIAEFPPPSRKEAGRGTAMVGQVRKIITLPLELQTSVDRWAREHDATVNMVIAKAVEVGL